MAINQNRYSKTTQKQAADITELMVQQSMLDDLCAATKGLYLSPLQGNKLYRSAFADRFSCSSKGSKDVLDAIVHVQGARLRLMHYHLCKIAEPDGPTGCDTLERDLEQILDDEAAPIAFMLPSKLRSVHVLGKWWNLRFYYSGMSCVALQFPMFIDFPRFSQILMDFHSLS